MVRWNDSHYLRVTDVSWAIQTTQHTEGQFELRYFPLETLAPSGNLWDLLQILFWGHLSHEIYKQEVFHKAQFSVLVHVFMHLCMLAGRGDGRHSEDS